MKIRLFTLTFLAAVVFAGCTYEEVTPLPVTPTEKRLNYYIESYKVPGLGFVPQTKVSYEYNETGRVRKYTVLSYHPDSGSLSELRYFVFSYVHNRVDNIKGFLAGENSPYVEYSYKYLVNNTVSMIRETNYAAGVNSELNFLYNAVDNSITATYTFSNGGSFEYEFNYESENILNDKTTRGAQLCSNGQYTYDQHINPFRNLGYVDYTLNNLSVNNKLTEAVSYIACSFPTLVPVSYAYEYNEDGYPTLVTTSYKSGSPVATAQKTLFYK